MADIICFDPTQQDVNKPKLFAWISYPKNLATRNEMLHFKHPKPVLAKFVTVVFIQSENLLDTDPFNEHPIPNVDV